MIRFPCLINHLPYRAKGDTNMSGIHLLIGVFVKLLPVILAVVVPLTIVLITERRDAGKGGW